MSTHEMVIVCPYCESTSISYASVGPHLEARCGICGKFIKHVKQYTNEHDFKSMIRQRDKYTCQRCGKPLAGRQAHVHHLLPVWFMPEKKYDDTNAIVLCSECHHQIHGAAGTIKDKDLGGKSE